jgi:hypothetical protein
LAQRIQTGTGAWINLARGKRKEKIGISEERKTITFDL